MTEILDLDARRIAPFLIQAINLFLIDPPDSDYQLGYLAALVAVYKEGLGRGETDARVIAAERILAR